MLKGMHCRNTRNEFSMPLSPICETIAAAHEVRGIVMHMFVEIVCTMYAVFGLDTLLTSVMGCMTVDVVMELK